MKISCNYLLGVAVLALSACLMYAPDESETAASEAVIKPDAEKKQAERKNRWLERIDTRTAWQDPEQVRQEEIKKRFALLEPRPSALKKSQETVAQPKPKRFLTLGAPTIVESERQPESEKTLTSWERLFGKSPEVSEYLSTTRTNEEEARRKRALRRAQQEDAWNQGLTRRQDMSLKEQLFLRKEDNEQLRKQWEFLQKKQQEIIDTKEQEIKTNATRRSDETDEQFQERKYNELEGQLADLWEASEPNARLVMKKVYEKIAREMQKPKVMPGPKSGGMLGQKNSTQRPLWGQG